MRHFSMRPAALMYQRFCFPEEGGDDGHGPLHMAAMMGDLADVTRRLDAGASVNAADQHGCTTLHHAALSSSVEVCLQLLERGAVVNARMNGGATALHVAAFNGRVAICKLLVLHNANVHAEDEDGHPPRYDALYMQGKACPCNADTPDSQNGRVAAFLDRCMELSADDRVAFVQHSWGLFVSQLLQGGVERPDLASLLRQILAFRHCIDARDYDGSTPLTFAAQLGRVEAVRALLSNGASVQCCTNLGESALHFAAREGHLEVARLLLASSADMHLKSRSGATPLSEARRHGGKSTEVAMMLEASLVPDRADRTVEGVSSTMRMACARKEAEAVGSTSEVGRKRPWQDVERGGGGGADLPAAEDALSRV